MSAFQLTIDEQQIAHLVFDLPGEKINKLSLNELDELDQILAEIETKNEIQALVITSAKEGVFIAGADLKSFEGIFKEPRLAEEVLEKGHAVFDRIAALPFPSIAVINGVCLGGGLELALACTYRIVGDHPKTSLGLPETTLGIFPGWGGTQRLPKLVGLTEGLKAILSGQPYTAQKAIKVHLADVIFPSEFLDEKVKEWVCTAITKEGRKNILSRRTHSGIGSLLLEKNPVGRALVYWQAKKNVLEKTKGHYPAPLAALEVVQETFSGSLSAGLKKEREAFLKGMPKALRFAPNLIHLFFASEAIKKEYSTKNPSSLPVQSVGVLGAGIMGSGIAWLFSYRDIPVRMKDVTWDAVGKGYKAIWDTYKILVRKRKLTSNQANQKFHQVGGTVDYEGFRHLDLVVEAAVENKELKQKILGELEQQVRNEAIIATNTSSLTIQELAQTMQHPERFVGMHFFNPPSLMPLVEIVAGPQTNKEVVEAAFEVALKLKKTPVVVGDCSGFLVNRVFGHGFVEMIQMFQEGIAMERLDRLFLRFGLPMAPFVLADEIGNDVNLKAMKSFEKAYGMRMAVPSILEAVNDKGFLGKKSGKGFYLYRNGAVDRPNPEVIELLKMVPKNRQESLSDEEVIDRVMLAMINEAARCLGEKVVSDPAHLDVALVFGVGFPPFRGGLLRYADEQGVDVIMEKLHRFEARFGEKYVPCDYLKGMQERGEKRFYLD